MEQRLTAFGMSPEAAKAYAAFLSGQRSLPTAQPDDR